MGCGTRSSQPLRSISTGSSSSAQGFACPTREPWAPASSSCGFDLDRRAQRITYFFPGEHGVVLLTVFRKQRTNERTEIERARTAMKRCVEEQHTAEDE